MVAQHSESVPGFARLHALDSEFLHLEDARSPMHIGGLCVFEGPAPSVADCVHLLQHKLALVPRYRMRLRSVPLGLGRPVWVNAERFEPAEHLHVVRGPHDAAALDELMGRIMSERLDRRRPLWELWLVEDVTPGRWALVTKVHHALVDGISSTELMSLILDTEPQPELPPPELYRPGPAPSRRALVQDALSGLAQDLQGWGRALSGAARNPQQAQQQAREIGEGLWNFARAFMVRRSSSLQGPIGGERAYAHVPAELAQVREIKRAFGTTLNDVVLCVLAAGYRELLQLRGDDPARARVRSLVPVSVRAPDARGVPGNQVSAVLYDLPVGVADPVERLATVARDMERLKASHMIEAGFFCTQLGDLAPPFVLGPVTRALARAMHWFPQSVLATVTTNVPGPRQPLYCLGRRLCEWYPYVPITQGARLGTAVLSYAGQLAFGITSDREHVPTLWAFTRALQRDLRELSVRAAATTKDSSHDTT